MKRNNIVCQNFVAGFLKRDWKKGLIFLILVISLEPVTLLTESADVTPLNTVIVSSRTDGEFCRDFSVFLRRLTIDWLYIENSDLPEEARTKNVIILGGPDAVCTGDIVTS
ncbi:MAG: hypothetical protein HXS46_19135, partial [Theionarchaea archaeon]|nr:hypothetical protein [Theionarchaea archaeon]